MREDPIVEEARRAGQALFARFNDDMEAVCEYLRQRTDDAARAGREVLSLPPRPAQPRPKQTKKAG